MELKARERHVLDVLSFEMRSLFQEWKIIPVANGILKENC